MNKYTSKNQRWQMGLSFWIILPWLIVMALVLYFAYQHMSSLSKQESSLIEPIWQPTITHSKIQETTSYHQAVSQAAQSVVNIYTTQQVSRHPYTNDPMFQRFIEQYYGSLPKRQENNLGSGVIVSKEGYIVTNAHVIEQADEIVVVLNDGRKAKASLIGADAESDLAVIKIDLDNLQAMAFRVEPILVGDVALAIGNPFGVGQTVTQGIISATGRAGIGVSHFEEFIQTDAAINPGNSGGALIDSQGALIGINTAIYSRSGGSMGIGFAIPTVIVEQVMNALIKDGRVSRGWLGVEIARHTNAPTQLQQTTGLLVTNVVDAGPAAAAGIQVGDILLSIDGVALQSDHTLVNLVAKKSPNTVLNVQLQRNNKKLTLPVTLAERPNFDEMKNQQSQKADQIERLLNQLHQLQRQ